MTEISHEKVEVVIAGSGIAGSTMAAELGEAGFSVLVLEAGPERRLSDMISSQIWSRRLRWAGPEVQETGDLVGAANFAMGWGTGGAGLHWYANWYRLHPDDFHVRSQYGRSLDWPISYDDLRPWYDHAQAYFGVSGDDDPNAPPGAPYPMPAIPMSSQSTAIKRGFDAEGLTLTSNTLAVNSVPYDGRAGCILDGWCDAGCPIGALANPLVLQWPRAKKAGVELRHNAYVARIETDSAGSKATGVIYIDENGQENFQPADIVISACHTIWNARLLLLSSDDTHPNGLGNGSGTLGHYFTSHALTTIHGLFEQETEPHTGVSGANTLCLDGYDNKQPAKDAFGSRAWLVGQAAKPNDLLGTALAKPEVFGAALDDYLRKASSHYGNMTVLCEEDSIPENRITLDPSKRDRFGLPQAHVTNSLPRANVVRSEIARSEGLRIFKAAGTSEAWAGPRNPMHMIGGTIMGSDPSSSVTNSFGQLHEVENVFVAGASLFPTPGAVNPTSTLAALVFRVADYIRTNRSSLLP
ncbi:GMC oxidoreductase [Ruegeria lacuscaerulensis]|uniref:GMC oxidoreductase n=1 Tax=Ruegeria lacuscaerulensis TaxID=55218 RepID=UPI00148138FB|nr:GMC family oxidoreductase [Ruegeria lacuscaerulensis]